MNNLKFVALMTSCVRARVRQREVVAKSIAISHATGQAPSYMIDNLEILRLREETKVKLGGKFDVRAFYDQLLGHASVALPLLRTMITEWAASTSKTK